MRRRVKTLADVPVARMRTVYLNDHIAAATGWTSLARRVARQNAGTPLGEVVEALARDFAEEISLLRALLRETGGSENKAKQWLVRSAEQIGRLKPNGVFRGYSPLSRLVETEALVASLALRTAMWRSLVTGFGPEHPVGRFSLHELAERASRQAHELDEQLRIVAGALAA